MLLIDENANTTEKKTKLYQSISYKNKHKQRPEVDMLKYIK